MSNSGWTAERLNVVYPPGAVPPDTFIYIGDAAGDPTGLLTQAGLDAGIVLAFGDRYGYVIGLFQEVGFNDGHFYIAGIDPAGAAFRMIETDWQPDSAGGGVKAMLIGNNGSIVKIDDDADFYLNGGDFYNQGGKSALFIPSCYVNLGGNIANGVATTLTPTSAILNNWGMWAGGTTITIPTDAAHMYEVGLVLRYDAQAASVGYRIARILNNGTDVQSTATPVPANLNGILATASIIAPMYLNAGDQISFGAQQSSGVVSSITHNSLGWVRQITE